MEHRAYLAYPYGNAPTSHSFRSGRPPVGPPERSHGSQYPEPYPLEDYAASSVATGNHGREVCRGQRQEQVQLQRSKEASKQMLYSVFGNFIAILEEYEARQSLHRHFRRSEIALADQSRKTNEDIESIVETQLLLFETQFRSCHSEARYDVTERLKWKAIQWSAVRAEQGCSMREADNFIAKLYEILETGRTAHAHTSRPKPTVSEETIRSNLPHIMTGKHDQATLDSAFKADSSRVAECPRVRKPVDGDAVVLGTQRIGQAIPSLVPALRKFVDRNQELFANLK